MPNNPKQGVPASRPRRRLAVSVGAGGVWFFMVFVALIDFVRVHEGVMPCAECRGSRLFRFPCEHREGRVGVVVSLCADMAPRGKRKEPPMGLFFPRLLVCAHRRRRFSPRLFILCAMSARVKIAVASFGAVVCGLSSRAISEIPEWSGVGMRIDVVSFIVSQHDAASF